jgi:hypothetical protein
MPLGPLTFFRTTGLTASERTAPAFTGTVFTADPRTAPEDPATVLRTADFAGTGFAGDDFADGFTVATLDAGARTVEDFSVLDFAAAEVLGFVAVDFVAATDGFATTGLALTVFAGDTNFAFPAAVRTDCGTAVRAGRAVTASDRTPPETAVFIFSVFSVFSVFPDPRAGATAAVSPAESSADSCSSGNSSATDSGSSATNVTGTFLAGCRSTVATSLPSRTVACSTACKRSRQRLRLFPSTGNIKRPCGRTTAVTFHVPGTSIFRTARGSCHCRPFIRSSNSIARSISIDFTV